MTEKTFETKAFRHRLMSIVFHENSSRNEEVMVILLSVHDLMLHPVVCKKESLLETAKLFELAV